MSRFNMSFRSSDRPMPFCSALREKYSQTLRSTETGKKTSRLKTTVPHFHCAPDRRIVSSCGSRNTVDAVLNVTPCLRTLAAALVSSHSNWNCFSLKVETPNHSMGYRCRDGRGTRYPPLVDSWAARLLCNAMTMDSEFAISGLRGLRPRFSTLTVRAASPY